MDKVLLEFSYIPNKILFFKFFIANMYFFLGQNNVCSPSPLPGYWKQELLSKILVEFAIDESKLSISSETRDRIIQAWNNLEERDRNSQNFRSAYQSHCGNTMYGRTKSDAAETTVTQRIKFNLCYTPAQLIDPKKNRLVYCIIKHLWLCLNKESTKAFSPDKVCIHTCSIRFFQTIPF